ncbi:hypothetical protein [Citrobacter freundii]|uniref:hypothetical protein n=1 Tax=Citrobacter freundii TaxID=546 RepID=UPI00222F8218|nr:hypothetical protein [Citrobacter freundii]BDT23202.1 hypothetical protein CF204P1_19250 [Citrobacter freundii]
MTALKKQVQNNHPAHGPVSLGRLHQITYAKDKQVARCGNAVPPPFAEALVGANLPELCQQQEIAA